MCTFIAWKWITGLYVRSMCHGLGFNKSLQKKKEYNFGRPQLPVSQRQKPIRQKFPFIQHQRYFCKQQSHWQTPSHHLSCWTNTQRSLLVSFSCGEPLMEEFSSSSTPSQKTALSWRTVIFHGRRVRRCVSSTRIIYFFNITHKGMSVISGHYLASARSAGKSWKGQSEVPKIFVSSVFELE